MAAADTLFDALRIPRQIVVDEQRTKLQVYAFGGGFGGNHNFCLIFKGINQRGAFVHGGRAGVVRAARVFIQPRLITPLAVGMFVAAGKQYDLPFVTVFS